ncbi:MAG: hypothetical protein COY47_01545 [Chloroflexi bacterium CG_4_10_14_0_8_um_filter_57_5]|nr:MAG: hypothetical protein COY47_01545 [Chloroflexi bacterium CG_4_10_14_0_8_um_filter_57_5]
MSSGTLSTGSLGTTTVGVGSWVTKGIGEMTINGMLGLLATTSAAPQRTRVVHKHRQIKTINTKR